ncbi:MAG TPA: cysteine desulfurase [bacterium]
MSIDRKTLDIEKIRADFPIFKRLVNGKPLVYLDNAATTQKPKQVIESIRRYNEEMTANIHRAVHTLSYESTVLYEEAHKKLAKFIGAQSWREIVFTKNATEAINLVAYAWGMWNLKQGDEIVVTLAEHHSNIVPWQMLSRLKGSVLRFMPVHDNGDLIMEEAKRLITGRTKLVGITHCSNVLGTVNPVADVVKLARDAGAITLVDAAQSLPHMKIDVRSIGCDFLAGSGHKMLGPSGTGFLYGRKELLQKMEPFNYGGDMIEKVTTESAEWNELPWKYEAGTPNISGGIGLGAAVDYLNATGMANIHDHELVLTGYALQRLQEIEGITIYGHKDTEKRLGVISFNIAGIHPHDIAGILDEEGIAVRSGHHCAQPLMTFLRMDNAVRLSFYIYNSVDEINKLIDMLKKIKSMF